jgi:branched-chain amino acid transport system ATP-binding protein
MNQLELRDLDVFYGASQILFGVSLAVPRGATMALLGRNGAGKTTTMKTVAGLLAPRRGRVLLDGADITGLAPHRIARRGLGYVPEDRQVFPQHTVADNLDIARKPGPAGRADWTAARVYAEFPALAELRRRQAGRLSGGEQQMLTIARALMGNPDIIMLDEPSEGLAPIIVERIAQLLHRLREMGVTILLAEQNMHFCLAVASDVAIIDKGQIVFTCTAAELRGRDEIARRYLAV